MLKRFFWISFALLLVLLLSNCSTMPPDAPVCVEITMSRGHCVKIISGQEFDVDDKNLFEKKTWWEMRPTFLQMPSSSWRAIKTYVISACK